jgi:hypothetical protein
LLSDALMTTRDGIVGYWDTGHLATVKRPMSLPDQDLSYLTPLYRGFVLDHVLTRTLEVSQPVKDGKAGKAIVTAKGNTLAEFLRPAPDIFAGQIKHLKTYADLRGDRLGEISVQIDDIVSFFGAIAHLDSGRRRYTLELVNAVQRLCFHVEFMVKHLCRATRPVDLSPFVQPMIQTPAHSSFPNGHATEAFAIATVMHRLRLGKASDPLEGIQTASMEFRLAERIAMNRIVAGVHFPVDTLAGAALGVLIGEAVIAQGNNANVRVIASKTIGHDFDADSDFNLANVHKLLKADNSKTVAQSCIIQEFWTKHVETEWR